MDTGSNEKTWKSGSNRKTCKSGGNWETCKSGSNQETWKSGSNQEAWKSGSDWEIWKQSRNLESWIFGNLEVFGKLGILEAIGKLGNLEVIGKLRNLEVIWNLEIWTSGSNWETWSNWEILDPEISNVVHRGVCGHWESVKFWISHISNFAHLWGGGNPEILLVPGREHRYEVPSNIFAKGPVSTRSKTGSTPNFFCSVSHVFCHHIQQHLSLNLEEQLENLKSITVDQRLNTSSRTVSGHVRVIQQEFSLLWKVFLSLKIVTMGGNALSPVPNKAIHYSLEFCWLDGVDDGVDLVAQLIHGGKPVTLEMLLDACEQKVIAWSHIWGISWVGRT